MLDVRRVGARPAVVHERHRAGEVAEEQALHLHEREDPDDPRARRPRRGSTMRWREHLVVDPAPAEAMVERRAAASVATKASHACASYRSAVMMVMSAVDGDAASRAARRARSARPGRQRPSAAWTRGAERRRARAICSASGRPAARGATQQDDGAVAAPAARRACQSVRSFDGVGLRSRRRRRSRTRRA